MMPLSDWNRFWFKPQTAYVLGLYRIVIGLLTLYSFALFAKDITLYFSDAGILTTQTLDLVMERDFHTILYWITSPWGVRLVLAALFIAGFCFTIGYKTRLSSIVLFALVASCQERNNLVLNGGDVVLRTMLFFFMFAPAGAALSVDSLRRRLKSPDPVLDLLVMPWPQRMMQIQVSVIYLVTAYAKSRGGLWHSGQALYYIFGLVDYNIEGVEQLMNYPVLYSALTISTLFVEAALAFLLWFRASRPYAVMAGIGLHAWIFFFMTLPVFPTLMIATYLSFFSEEEFQEALKKARNLFRKKRAKVYYDGICPLCRRSKKWVEAFDLLRRVEFIDFRGLPPEEYPASVKIGDLEEAMHLATPGGRVIKGFEAFRWILARLPATFWLAPLLWLPGVPWLGRKFYAHVAARRLLGLQCDNASQCETKP